jgi:Spy/CpxP family protein refolding chaperone
MPSLRILSIAALVAGLFAPAAVFAQQTPLPVPAGSAAPGHRHHGSRWMHAIRSLNLSASQQRQIQDAVAQTRQANRNADQQTRRANRQKLHAQIEAILTPDQRAQLKSQLQRGHQAQRPV